MNIKVPGALPSTPLYTENLTVLLGSQDEANKLVKELKDFAANTQLEFGGIIRSAERLLATGSNASEILPELRRHLRSR